MVRQVHGIKYSTLSSVAWVNRYWVATALALLLTLNVLAGVSIQKNTVNKYFWPMFVMIILLLGTLAYPYYHYRKHGGYVKRIPPRFVTEKPVFVQMYE